MRNEVCICKLITVIPNNTPITVLMHHREFHKTTNTARIAHLALQKCEIRLHGLKPPADSGESESTQQTISFSPGRQPILLTLKEQSEVLTPTLLCQFDRPLHLIVPDGNWRQASKMGKRVRELQNIPWVN